MPWRSLRPCEQPSEDCRLNARKPFSNTCTEAPRPTSSPAGCGGQEPRCPRQPSSSTAATASFDFAERTVTSAEGVVYPIPTGLTVDHQVLGRDTSWRVHRIVLLAGRRSYSNPHAAWYFAGLLHYLFDGATVELDFS